MSKQINMYDGEPEVCPYRKEYIRYSKIRSRVICEHARKPQDCINTGQCTQWKKVRDGA